MSESETLLAYRRLYGFRISAVDAVAIALSLGGCVWLWKMAGQFALLLPVVLFHFFLFCNVFRVRRTYELIWTFLFILNFSLQVLFWTGTNSSFNWWVVGGIQFPITLAVILLEMRSPEYHGIGCQRLNSRLLEYLKNRISLLDIVKVGPLK